MLLGTSSRETSNLPVDSVITDWEQLTDLKTIRYKDGAAKTPKLFYLLEDFIVSFRIDGDLTTYTARKGMGTDFPSIPQAIQNIIPVLGLYDEAAVIHDQLCYDKGPWPSRTAAAIFNEGMRAAGVPLLQRNVMYRAVLRFGPQWN